jgi:uncharacterized protein YndB with AHSA1/START domain
MITKNVSGAVVEVAVQVDAPVDAVWRAITDPEEIRRWFPLDARGDGGTVGGLVEVTWGDDAGWGLRVAGAQPGRHLRLHEAEPPPEGQPLPVIDIHLSDEGGGTAVRLVHSGFGSGEEWGAYLDGLDAGWGYFLRNLKVYLERHPDRPRVMAWARPAVRGSRDAIWSAILGVYGVDPAGLAPGADGCPVTLGGSVHPGHVEAAVPGRTLGVRLPGLDHAILFVEVESEGEKGRVGIWLSTYGMDDADVARLQWAVDASARELTRRTGGS